MSIIRDVKIRKIKPTDLPAVVLIENASFPTPWEIQDFRHTLSSKDNIGFLAEINKEVIGYCIYHMEQDQLSIISIAVAPHMRRKKIGLIMLLGEDAIEELECKSVRLTVSDDNLPAHLFFRAMGFKAETITRNFFGPGHDGYNFVYRPGNPYKLNKRKQLDESCQGK